MAEPNPFDLYLGLLLARLYEARPKRLDLAPEDFGLPDRVGEDQAVWDKWDDWSNTVTWLSREGYIRFEQYGNGMHGEPVFQDTELAEKGFRALNSLPSGLKGSEDKRSFGAQLVDLGKKTAWKGANKLGERGAEETGRKIADLVQAWMS